MATTSNNEPHLCDECGYSHHSTACPELYYFDDQPDEMQDEPDHFNDEER